MFGFVIEFPEFVHSNLSNEYKKDVEIQDMIVHFQDSNSGKQQENKSQHESEKPEDINIKKEEQNTKKDEPGTKEDDKDNQESNPTQKEDKKTEQVGDYIIVLDGLDDYYQISSPKIVTFSVKVLNANQSDNVRVSIKNNSTVIDLGNGNFQITIQLGSNVFEVVAEGNEKSAHLTKNVIGSTKKLDVDSSLEYLGDKNALAINSNFNQFKTSDGRVVTQNQNLTLNISTSSYGEKLYSENIEVYINGQKYTNTPTFNSKGEYEYQLFFDKGTEGDEAVSQLVTIITWDEYGNCRKTEQLIEYEYRAEASLGGQVHIYLDASVIGYSTVDLGECDFYVGQSYGDILFGTNGVFEQNDISFEYYRGYLKWIGNCGFTSLSVESDLKKIINMDIASGGEVEWTSENDEDELGEFDFTTRSGWMYEICRDEGSTYPGTGFNDRKPVDGDEVYIRYTLNLGKDIGASTDSYCYIWKDGEQLENQEGHHFYNDEGNCEICGIKK